MRGVYFDKHYGKWHARLYVGVKDGKPQYVHVGRFDSELEAIYRLKKFAKRYDTTPPNHFPAIIWGVARKSL